MSVSIISNSRLARPSGVIVSTMTDAERLAFGLREIDFCFDAAEQATEYAGLAFRDRARGLALPAIGGVMSTLNGYPAVDWGADSSGQVTAPYQVPSSYTIFAAASLDTTTTTNEFAGSQDQSGARLFFGTLADGSLRLDHGVAAGNSIVIAGTGNTGAHVWWAAFDSATGNANLGRDAVSPQTTGTIGVPHKGQATTSIFGGPGVAEIDGKGCLCVVVPRYLGSQAQVNARSIILSWLAQTVGVSLAA